MSLRSILAALRSIPPFPRTRAGRRAGFRPRLEPMDERCLPSLSPAASLPVGANPQAVVAADFNADGHLDLAAANYDGGTVSVLLGDGRGGFGAARHFAAGANPRSVAVGDFNGDGKLDLVTANQGGYDVSVLLGNGDGTLQPASRLNIGSSPASVAVGDFNGDGNLDIGVTSNVYTPGNYGGYYYGSYGHYDGRADVLLGNGTGLFSAPTTTALGYGYHTSAAAADFNGDGYDDFATVNYDYATVSVLLGAGTGAPLGTPASFATGWYPQAVTAGDFTGDGILDLATAGQSVDILPGYGDGTFRPVVQQYIDPVAIAAADFNGDGSLDAVTADPWANTVNVLLGTDDGTLWDAGAFAAGSSPTAVAVGDFDEDGRPDVAVASAGSNTVSVLLNAGTWPDPNAPRLRIADATVTEGNAGTVEAVFTVTLSAASGQPVTVAYATADGTALAGSDYVAASGTVTIPAGQTSATFTVAVLGDRLGEANESFAVNLSAPTNAVIADGQGVGNILDDEPRISVGDATVTEGNSGTVNATFTVTLSFATDAEVTVLYGTANGTAAAGSDYQALSGTLTFAPGETSKTISVVILGDQLFEPNETFTLNLSNPGGAMIADGTGVGTIVNDDSSLPRISISDVTRVEGRNGNTFFVFTVTLSAPSTTQVKVSYATADGTARSGEDYEAASGTLTFAPGETTKTVTIKVKGDSKKEADETFYLDLFGNSGNSLFTRNRGTGTILNDD